MNDLSFKPALSQQDREEAAAAALARFRAQWPPERCKLLGDAVMGDGDALRRMALRAVPKPTTDADRAVMGLLTDDALRDLSRVQRRLGRMA